MSVHFQCAACGEEHPSRLHARSRDLMTQIGLGLGQVLEVCPATREWVVVRLPQLAWRPLRPDAPPAGAAADGSIVPCAAPAAAAG